MPEYTTKFNLPKPLPNEYVSREAHNSLADAIDSQIGGVIAAHEGDFTSHKAESASNAHRITNIEGLQTDLNSRAKTVTYTTTLDTTWSGSASPYTKTQTVTGILATDNPVVDIQMSGTFATDEARLEAWGNIYRITTAANSITLYATEKPTVSLPIQLKVVR